MTHHEKRLYLIKELLSELPQYKNAEIPDNATDQKHLLRSLMNIRPPRPIGTEFLKILDAIVNAANSALRGCFVPCHSCVDNIIHSVSGIQLRLACDKIMTKQGFDEPTGTAKITPAFNLPCKYVLHTVGPIVLGQPTKEHCKQLADCYQSCLKLASEHKLKSVAFCCISTGEFHFPQEKAAEIAVNTVSDYLQTNTRIEKVVFNVFKQEDYKIYNRLLN